MFRTDVRTSLLLFVTGVVITYLTVSLSVTSHVMFISLFSKLVHQVWWYKVRFSHVLPTGCFAFCMCCERSITKSCHL